MRVLLVGLLIGLISPAQAQSLKIVTAWEAKAKQLVAQGKQWNELDVATRQEFQCSFTSVKVADEFVNELTKRPKLVFAGAKEHQNPRRVESSYWVEVLYRAEDSQWPRFHQLIYFSYDRATKTLKVTEATPIKLRPLKSSGTIRSSHFYYHT